jgi:glutamate synthase domain-containing protein 1
MWTPSAKSPSQPPKSSTCSCSSPPAWTPLDFERKLYLCRREIEHRTKEIHGFYMPSFSNRLISYKALAMPAALRAFYLDFANPDYEVAIASTTSVSPPTPSPPGRSGSRSA